MASISRVGHGWDIRYSANVVSLFKCSTPIRIPETPRITAPASSPTGGVHHRNGRTPIENGVCRSTRTTQATMAAKMAQCTRTPHQRRAVEISAHPNSEPTSGGSTGAMRARHSPVTVIHRPELFEVNSVATGAAPSVAAIMPREVPRLLRQLEQRRWHPAFVAELVAHLPPDLLLLAGGVESHARVQIADDLGLVVVLLVQLAWFRLDHGQLH